MYRKERRVLSEADKALENAKWGIGIAAILGKVLLSREDLLAYHVRFLKIF